MVGRVLVGLVVIGSLDGLGAEKQLWVLAGWGGRGGRRGLAKIAALGGCWAEWRKGKGGQATRLPRLHHLLHTRTAGRKGGCLQLSYTACCVSYYIWELVATMFGSKP